MTDWLSKMFGQDGAMYTGDGAAPGVQARMDNAKNPLDPAFAEKGSILGMSPSTFSSIAGQMGAAVSPKDSWQAKLGGLAAQMGSQKLGQLMQAEKEKRSLDLYKQMLKAMSSKDLVNFAGVSPTDTGIGGGFDPSKNREDFDKALGAGTPAVKSF